MCGTVTITTIVLVAAQQSSRQHSTEETIALINAEPGLYMVSDVHRITIFERRSSGSAQLSDRPTVTF